MKSIRQEDIGFKKVKVSWNNFIKLKRKRFTDDYIIQKKIGKGANGTVYKVLMKNGNACRAAKKINKEELSEDDEENLFH